MLFGLMRQTRLPVPGFSHTAPKALAAGNSHADSAKRVPCVDSKPTATRAVTVDRMKTRHSQPNAPAHRVAGHVLAVHPLRVPSEISPAGGTGHLRAIGHKNLLMFRHHPRMGWCQLS